MVHVFDIAYRWTEYGKLSEYVIDGPQFVYYFVKNSYISNVVHGPVHILPSKGLKNLILPMHEILAGRKRCSTCSSKKLRFMQCGMKHNHVLENMIG